jgi:predicted RNA binding protein YcfA (HicA-like mRNA interferase family)
MKSSEMYKILISRGWYVVSQKGSHVKMKHASSQETIIFPNHGAAELGKGLEKKLLKQSEIKK